MFLSTALHLREASSGEGRAINVEWVATHAITITTRHTCITPHNPDAVLHLYPIAMRLTAFAVLAICTFVVSLPTLPRTQSVVRISVTTRSTLIKVSVLPLIARGAKLDAKENLTRRRHGVPCLAQEIARRNSIKSTTR